MHMAELLRGRLCENEPMARHVSWRAGGVARRAFFPVDRDDLANFMHTLPRDEAVLMVGLGSNLLVRDGGFAGTAIFGAAHFSRLIFAIGYGCSVTMGRVLPISF